MDETDQNRLTEGSVPRKMLAFALPIFLSNLFQQLYNAVDSLIVGNFIGSAALAAVGSSASMIMLLVGFINGVSLGAGVVIARFYGADDRENLSRALHTTVAVGIAAGLVLTVVGVLLTPQILRWMGTPGDVIGNSIAYFRVYFLGSSAVVLYNMCASILQSVGDSRSPMKYLIFASLTNVVLDLLFVAVFRWGVASAALATILSQTLSALLAFRKLTHTGHSYRLSWRQVRFHGDMLRQVVYLGIPSGVQNSVISLANVIVQANINAYGAMAMAGFGSYLKIEGFAQLPMQSFCLAATTFTGQNIGAKRYDRVKKGMLQNLVICFLYAGAACILLYIFAPVLTAIFSEEPEVVRYGTLTMRLVIPFYMAIPIHQVLMGTMRGAGKTFVSMMISVGNMCILRMIYINLFVPFFPSYEAVLLCYPITWASTATMDILYAWRGKWLPEEE